MKNFRINKKKSTTHIKMLFKRFCFIILRGKMAQYAIISQLRKFCTFR